MPRIAKVVVDESDSRMRFAEIAPRQSQFDRMVEFNDLLDSIANLNLAFLQTLGRAARDCPAALASELDTRLSPEEIDALASLDLSAIASIAHIRVPLFTLNPAFIRAAHERWAGAEMVDDILCLQRSPVDTSPVAAQLSARMHQGLTMYLMVFQRAAQQIPNQVRAILPNPIDDEDLQLWTRLTPEIRGAIACTATPTLTLTVGQIRTHLLTDDPLRLLALSLISLRRSGASLK